MSNNREDRENSRTIDRLDINDKQINGTKQPFPLSTNDESKNEKGGNIELNTEYSQEERINIILEEVKTLSNEKNGDPLKLFIYFMLFMEENHFC